MSESYAVRNERILVIEDQTDAREMRWRTGRLPEIGDVAFIPVVGAVEREGPSV